MTPSLIPLKYREARKRIMNQLGKFESSSVLNALIWELRAFEASDLQQFRRRPPWRTLLLIRWFLQRGHYSSGHRPPMSQGDLAKLINAAGDLEVLLELPSDHPDFTLFLRKIAFQQFWFQENLQLAHFTRQLVLFRQLPVAHPLATLFERVVGVPIAEFVTVLAAITLHLAPNQVTVDRSFFTPLEPYFSRPTIDGVLATISKDRNGLRDFLRANPFDDVRSHYEYYARTPLARYPLLRSGTRFIPYSSTVLGRGAETLVYDILREEDASTLMNHFGELFELYVRRGITLTGSPFLDEKELKQRFGSGKVVDFAFSCHDGTLLIDAKGVELPLGALVTREVEFLSSRLQNSVFKGLEQAADMASRMKLTEPPYVLIITYKDLQLGNGADLSRYVDQTRVPRSLDMTRVYFASVEEFDYLAAGLRSHGMHPIQFFEKVRSLDADPSTKKYRLMQHINSELRPYGTPDYLKNEEDALMQILKQALPSQ